MTDLERTKKDLDFRTKLWCSDSPETSFGRLVNDWYDKIDAWIMKKTTKSTKTNC
jgi:hypothetical protein